MYSWYKIRLADVVIGRAPSGNVWVKVYSTLSHEPLYEFTIDTIGM